MKVAPVPTGFGQVHTGHRTVLCCSGSAPGISSAARGAARIKRSQQSPSRGIPSPAPCRLCPDYFIPDPKTAKRLEPALGQAHACHLGSQEPLQLTQH